MIVVAALVLPAVTLLLFGMDRIEDWMSRPSVPRVPPAAQVAAGRHLRLLPRPRRGTEDVPVAEPLPAAQDAA
ncbi:hypothetical protein V2S66_00895 [Streptomyces sp. V4-01]|uniref:Uncharacterized protein n=1 Tax=Actinacidiphila polyblastidii TaxID=3110430 RepID=A0ABU7P4E0_9ACTN|nr:hypothetical protein [Streptomyces sp. V4-01]